MFYSDTRANFLQLMLDLSTILQSKCVFFCFFFVILNKTYIFTPCSRNTRNIVSLKFATKMKATIVKNDKFETIGFHVENGDERIFNWGIAATSFDFTKEVNVTKWINEIFKLVELNAILWQQEHFVSKAFGSITTDKTNVRIRDNKEEVEATKAKIEKIISSII